MNIAKHATGYSASDFAYSIVSFEEQARGANAFVGAARRPSEVVQRHRLLEMVLSDFTTMKVLPFDDKAAEVFDRLRSQRVKVGTMDLRIASIALSNELILLTRNTRDFDKIPGLVTENWTVS